jgi:hypothetical protein
MQDESPSVDSAPPKGFTVHIKHAALWSSLVFGGMALGHVLFSPSVTAQSVVLYIAMCVIGGVIYGVSLWWFEDERPRRRTAERADP